MRKMSLALLSTKTENEDRIDNELCLILAIITIMYVYKSKCERGRNNFMHLIKKCIFIKQKQKWTYGYRE